MLCDIKTTVISGEVIIDLAGRLAFLDLSLRDKIDKLLKEGHRDFILEMSNLSYLDSFGLGQLVGVRNTIEGAGGQVRLSRPPEHVRRLLQLTRLDTVFSIVNEERTLALGVA